LEGEFTMLDSIMVLDFAMAMKGACFVSQKIACSFSMPLPSMTNIGINEKSFW
jgi:hypothetical protein